MSTDKIILLITGKAGSGKSQLIEKLARKLRRNYSLGGFFTRGIDRREDLSGAANQYDLVPVDPDRAPVNQSLVWARRQGKSCVFDETTRAHAATLIRDAIDRRHEVVFIDEIGPLELQDKGFAQLFRDALASDCPVVVASIKKRAAHEIAEYFQIQNAEIIDLDETNPRLAFVIARQKIRAMDAARIGAFAGINGLVEVGLGSMLRALKIPMKGHALAYLQNILLITFGKSLRGRGLFRITFIASMLKAFSPVGGTIRPMLYILLQGSIFALPIAAFGFHFATVLTGSILMAWLTLVMKLLINYIVFGMAFFDAYAGAIDKVNEWAQIQGLSLWSVIAALFGVKTMMALAVAAVAYFGNMAPLVDKLKKRPKWAFSPRRDLSARDKGQPHATLGRAALGALRDIFHWKFILFFFISALIILFFANLSTADFTAIVIRGVCISYVGFLALRRVDFQRFGAWLDKKMGLGLGKSLPVAMGILMKDDEQDANKKGPRGA